MPILQRISRKIKLGPQIPNRATLQFAGSGIRLAVRGQITRHHTLARQQGNSAYAKKQHIKGEAWNRARHESAAAGTTKCSQQRSGAGSVMADDCQWRTTCTEA